MIFKPADGERRRVAPLTRGNGWGGARPKASCGMNSIRFDTSRDLAWWISFAPSAFRHSACCESSGTRTETALQRKHARFNGTSDAPAYRQGLYAGTTTS
jgi:hypothetical protein